MASIIPGYNNDIFISYRQKDNRGERWVSEFVESLKTELESAFKEEVSAYLDITAPVLPAVNEGRDLYQHFQAKKLWKSFRYCLIR